MPLFGSKAKRLAREGDVGGLIDLLEVGRPKDREAAANKLAGMNLGTWRDRAVNALIHAAGSGEVGLRCQAIFALGEHRAQEARDVAAAGLADADWSVRMFACVAVARMGDATSVPRLRELAQDEDDLVRMQAVSALGDLAKPDDAALGSLLGEISESDPDQGVRDAAREALERLDSKG